MAWGGLADPYDSDNQGERSVVQGETHATTRGVEGPFSPGDIPTEAPFGGSADGGTQSHRVARAGAGTLALTDHALRGVGNAATLAIGASLARCQRRSPH